MKKIWDGQLQWTKKQIYYAAVLAVCVVLVAGIAGVLLKNDGKKKNESQKGTEQQAEIGGKKAKRKAEQKEVENPTVRVLLKTDGFQNTVHPSVELMAAGGLTLYYGNEKRECGAGESILIAPDDTMFQNGAVRIEPKVQGEKITILSLNRGYGTPSYRGILELITTAEGIAVVNELPMEEYLYAVVPSEMPASYELEALKAQAVCARSYAYNQCSGIAYPEYGANVDDSTSFQVYGNSEEQERAVTAVNETAGEKLTYNGQVVTTYYYSTSCGKTTSQEAWGTEPNDSNGYLQSVEVKNEQGEDYEKDLAWYRWTAVVDSDTLSRLISQNTGTDIGSLQNVEVKATAPGGAATRLEASGTLGSVTVETENKIRTALGGNGYTIEKNDGTIIDSMQLLPSAFFTIAKENGTYVIRGGGFGHGIGMSQNGANEMAKQGKNYAEILQFFYCGAMIA